MMLFWKKELPVLPAKKAPPLEESWPDEIWLTVTPDDWRRSLPHYDSRTCPVALALKRYFGADYASVGFSSADIFARNFSSGKATYILPKLLQRKISLFDHDVLTRLFAIYWPSKPYRLRRRL